MAEERKRVGFIWWPDCYLEFAQAHFVGRLKMGTKAGEAEHRLFMRFMGTKPYGGDDGVHADPMPEAITVEQLAADFERWKAEQEHKG